MIGLPKTCRSLPTAVGQAVCVAGTIWDSQRMTPNDIELRRVTPSGCCAWPSPRIWLICKALNPVSHGRGHRFKPCTAHQIKYLGVLRQYSPEFGPISPSAKRTDSPQCAPLSCLDESILLEFAKRNALQCNALRGSTVWHSQPRE
jgi:hypothetical protein